MSDSNDVNIELGQSVRRHIEHRTSPLDDSKLCALPYDEPEADRIPVFVAENVMRSIEEHAFREKDREIGGVLLGSFYRNDKESFVEVTGIIEAKAAKGTDASLTFTHETWEQILDEQARRGDDTRIVGWYHSHPGLGVFMSREDEFIHSGFFTDPWQVAVVVDPIYHNWGCFKWNDGTLERTGGFYVFAEKRAAKRLREYVKTAEAARRPAPRSASASADRRETGSSRLVAPLLALALILLVSQAVIGYLALRKPDYAAMAREHLRAGDLSGGARYLALAATAESLNECVELSKALNMVAADPRLAGIDSERLDQINYLIYRARATTERLQGNAVPKTHRILKSAEKTYAQRLQRAELIWQKLNPDKKTPKHARADKGIFEYALRQLQQERLWLMAYTQCCEMLEKENSEKLAAGLDAHDKKTFDRFCRILATWYQQPEPAAPGQGGK